MKHYFEKFGATAKVFIDNNLKKQGCRLEGLPIVSLDEFTGECERVPVVIASHAYNQIAWQLLLRGATDFYLMPALSFYFDPDLMLKFGTEIQEVFELLNDEESRSTYAAVVKAYVTGNDGYFSISDFEQYFHPLVKPISGDILIDGGAFNGDTARRFHQLSHPEKIIAVEPFSSSFDKLLENTKRFNANCAYVNKALWSDERTLCFRSECDAPEGNCISDDGSEKISTTTIDCIAKEFQVDRIDLIKLDVEGAEIEALKGAKDVIETFHPRLQVCIYHSMEDLWKIPLFIDAHFPGYDFHIGHHSPDPHESVLYAV